MRFVKKPLFLKIFLTVISFIYAFLLLFLIPIFFYNYSGEWMRKIEKRFNLKIMEFKNENR